MNTAVLNYTIKKALKKLNLGVLSKNGRNGFGRICVFHRGGGNLKKYRLIDFHRRLNLFGYVYKILYDPNRTSFIGLIFYENGLFSYIILSDNMSIGSKVFSGDSSINNSCYLQGSAIPLKYIPLFNIVNNVEFFPRKGAVFVRSAGNGAIIISKTFDNITLKLKSG